MKRTTTLLVAALAIAVLVLLAAVAVPGALADQDEPLRPAQVDHRESAVQAGAVTGETVTLHVETRFGHRGGPARNVTIEVRAIDADSGMLVETNRTELGTLSGEHEHDATTAVTVPRDGGYELRTALYVDGERRGSGTQTVSGVGTLIPGYARTNVAFQSFPGQAAEIPPIVYSIDRVEDDRATLEVTPFLTNAGDEAESGLELVLIARQSDSNIVADRTVVPVGAIDPGQTTQPSLQVTVPDGYNYRLDAMLRRDGVIVATTSVPASLDPTEEVSEDVTTRDVGLETGDFERDADRGRNGPPDGRDELQGESGPGFGAVTALLALVAGGVLYARRYR